MQTVTNLSKKQQEIVNIDSGAIYVKASAGSGKTRILVEKIKRILKNTEKNVLALTFTNRAANEMKSRFENLEEDGKRVFFGTIHGFCKNIIEQRYNLIGFSDVPHIFENDKDRLVLIEEAINLSPIFKKYYEDKQKKEKEIFLYKVLEGISNIKRNFYTEDYFIQSEKKEVWLLYKNYQDILFSLNAIDFDDLLLLTYKIFIENENIAKLYKKHYGYICIDEAQDLNKAQYNIVHILGNKEQGNVMMVGDPNQSIFGFNGSSSEYVERNFIDDFNAKIIKLEENYRSSKKILEVSNKLMGLNCELKNQMIEGEFIFSEYETEEKEAKEVIDKIKELVELENHKDIEGPINYRKICILARNKYVFNSIEKQLKEENIPYYYKISPGRVIFESDLMKIFDLSLKVKLNSEDRLHWEQLCGDLGIEYKKYKKLEEILNHIDDTDKKKIIDNIIKLSDDASNFSLIVSELEKIRTSDDNAQNMFKNDIELLKSSWKGYSSTNEYKTLVNFRNAMALGQTSNTIEEDGITLSTVHTMKGQEFEIVFLIGVDEGTFPDYRAVEKGGIDLEQEKNNMYVAFTRAKRFLYVSYPKNRKMPWGMKRRERSSFLRLL